MRLEVNLVANLVYWGNDVVTLGFIEAELLHTLNASAPDTADYDAIRRAIWGRGVLPANWERDLASAAARLRVKIAPWGFAILCQSRIGYRLVQNPVMAGRRGWRGDEELLLCKLVAEGLKPTAIAARLPRHSVNSVKQKLVRLKRASGVAGAVKRHLPELQHRTPSSLNGVMG
jgi:hypothetical protein